MNNQGGWAGMLGGMGGMPGMTALQQQANMSAGLGMGLGAGAGLNTGLGAMGAGQNMTAMTPAMQMLYQQYALRWAAMQKVAASTGLGGMLGGMGGMGAGMGGMGPGAAGMLGGQQGMMQQQQQQHLQQSGPGGQGSGRSMGPSSKGMGPGQNQGQGGPGGEDPGLFFKTRICNKWREGNCPFVDTCKYAHGEHELRTVDLNISEGVATGQPSKRVGTGGPQGYQLPYRQGTQQGGMMGGKGPETGAPRMKTRLCQEFMESSKCRYGDKCTFAHGQHELRTMVGGGMGGMGGGNFGQRGAMPPDALQQMDPKQREGMRKTRLCEKFMQTGSCGYGDKCTFAHGQHELRSRPPMSTGITRAPQLPLGAGAAAAVAKTGLAASLRDTEDLRAHPAKGDEEGGEGEAAVGTKRQREETAEEGEAGVDGLPMDGATGAGKKLHLEEEDIPEPDCPLCAHLFKAGRQKVMAAITGLESKLAQKLGCMVLTVGGPRIDQLWHKVQPATVMEWLNKTEGLTIMDKIEVLQAVAFHTHITAVDGRTPEGGLGLDSQKYVDMGLPPDCADFLYLVMDGREGQASMSEYFHMLEVSKQLFGINDDNYYTVSTAVASIMMGM